MTRFLLNQQPVSTDLPPGLPLLDFVRYHRHLKGTKIGCREGDCGACTVLIGSLENGQLSYQSVTSCLMPLGNAQGKHVVTIEGLNLKELSPVQQAIIAENGTQCGFCTVGFVVSLTGFCLQPEPGNQEKAVAAMDGNICRCTGYKSLERAAARLVSELQQKPTEQPLEWLTKHNFLPEYFKTVPEKLQKLAAELESETEMQAENAPENAGFTLSGGTDLLVQKPETVRDSAVKLLWQKEYLKGIKQEGSRIVIGGGATVTDLFESELMQQHFSNLQEHLKLVSSTQIRNMGTLAGNFANASPIGDLTIYFLALNATLLLQKREATREIQLRDLYLGYKTLAKDPDEIIVAVSFEIPAAGAFFNFEKVSKRMHLDIASVNAALQLHVENHRITRAFASAGGIGPVPTFLAKTSEFLLGKEISGPMVLDAAAIAQAEVKPISDARGTAAYKTLLLRQLFLAHFLKFFPELLKPASLL